MCCIKLLDTSWNPSFLPTVHVEEAVNFSVEVHVVERKYRFPLVNQSSCRPGHDASVGFEIGGFLNRGCVLTTFRVDGKCSNVILLWLCQCDSCDVDLYPLRDLTSVFLFLPFSFSSFLVLLVPLSFSSLADYSSLSQIWIDCACSSLRFLNF